MISIHHRPDQIGGRCPMLKRLRCTTLTFPMNDAHSCILLRWPIAACPHDGRECLIHGSLFRRRHCIPLLRRRHQEVVCSRGAARARECMHDARQQHSSMTRLLGHCPVSASLEHLHSEIQSHHFSESEWWHIN